MSETAVVVGASGAMGQVIASKLVSRRLRVIAVARTEAALHALAETSDQIIPCACDISSDDAIEHLREKLDGPVRMIVHGPGVATAGGVSAAPTAAVVDAVNIKVGGLLRVVRAADTRLVEGARIVAIGGLYGFGIDEETRSLWEDGKPITWRRHQERVEALLSGAMEAPRGD